MGRRKIEIQPITHERNRAVTFVKRKNGLFKKAYELGVLCSVDVAVIIFEDRIDQHPKLHQYCSSSIGIDDIVRRHRAHSGDTETRGPVDFGSAPSAGNRKAAVQDMDDDDEEEEEEAAEAPVRGGRGRVPTGRAPNPPARPTPNVSAVRSAPAPPRRSLPLRQAAAKRRRYAEDDEDEDEDPDDEYKQRNEDNDAEGDEDADGDYEYTGPGATRRSGRMAEAVTEVRRTAAASLPISNDRGGGERSSRIKRARVDEGPIRGEPGPRGGGGDYVGSYRGDYGGYREDHGSSSGYQGSALHLHSRSRSPPHRSSYPYPYPSSGPGSSSYPSTGPGMAGSAYGGPGSYQSPIDIYSYPPPNPPPNPYPAPHTHSYPQQPQSYTRGPHRPFHTGTGTSSPNPGSPHSFSTSSPHPYPPQSQGGYPPNPSPHQHPNGYGTPPLRLEPPLRSDDSYLRADTLYPPPPRPDNTYIAPSGLAPHIHPHSQYTLPPLDPAGPAAPRRTPPRRLRSHGQGRAQEESFDDVVGRRGSGLANVLDLPSVSVGGDAPFPSNVAGLGLPTVGVGAPSWEGAGTTRELLNAFLATPGPGSNSGPATERASVPGGAAAGAGESGELDWPVHVPSSAKGAGGSSSRAEAGGGKSSGEENVESSVTAAKSEPAKRTSEMNMDVRSTTPGMIDMDTKVDTTFKGRATSPSAMNTKSEAPLERDPPPPEKAVPILDGSDRRTPDEEAQVSSTSTNTLAGPSSPGTEPAPRGGNANEVDWLDFLSGAAAEANAAQRADVERVATVSDLGEVGHREGVNTGMVVDADPVGDINANADDENAEDAEGEPDIEEDDLDVNMGELRGVAPAVIDSDASSVADEDQSKSASVKKTSSPSPPEKTPEEPLKGDVVSTATIEDTTRDSPKDQATKADTEDNMPINRVI